MQHGFLKLAAVTPTVAVANCEQNAAAAIAAILRAEQEGARLVVLPALCLTGATCGDLINTDALLHATLSALDAVRRFSEGSDTLLVLGAPLMHDGALFNCGVVLQGGRIRGVVPAAGRDAQGIFAPAPEETCRIALLGQDAPFGSRLLFCCEDMPSLRFGVIVGGTLRAPQSALHALTAAGATLLCHPDACGETVGMQALRKNLIGARSLIGACAYAYAGAGAGESTGDAVYAGHDLLYENGALLAEAAPFQGGYALSEIDTDCLAREQRLRAPSYAATDRIPFPLAPAQVKLSRAYSKTPFLPEEPAALAVRCDEAAAIAAEGLTQRIRHVGAKALVLGVSGGVDSTLALLTCLDALALLERPASDILAVTMPCFGTSHRTKDNAEKLCEALHVPLRSIDIGSAVSQHLQAIGHAPELFDAAFENAQARERTQILMDLANMHGGFVVGTGDLSELALGFATYNGDHMSMYGVNADIPKTLIRAMLLRRAERLPRAAAAVLADIVATPVSPELLPGKGGTIAQITEDIVGPYELVDFFLYHFVRRGESKDKILRLAQHAFSGDYDGGTLAKWYEVFCRRFFAAQFKRSCLPDGPRIGSVSLSPRGDWRMPSDAKADSFL